MPVIVGLTASAIALTGCAAQSETATAREACETAAIEELGEDVTSVDISDITTDNLSEALFEVAGGTLQDDSTAYSTIGEFTFRTEGATHKASMFCVVRIENGEVVQPVEPIISGDPRA